MKPWINEKYGIQLYRGDCIDIVPTLEAGSIDAVITDPPYGTTACRWDTCIPFDVMWAFIKHVRKPNAAVVLTGSEPYSSALRMSNTAEYKYDWYWQKEAGTGFLNSKKQPLRVIENASVFYGKQCIYIPEMRQGFKLYSVTQGEDKTDNYGKFHTVVTESSGERYPIDIIKFSRDKNKDHPTQKPVALMEYLIRTYTNPGDTVLDFTSGSGTTPVACVNTGRRCIAIEKDTEKHGDKYYRIGIDRVTEAIQNAEADMFRSAP